MPAAVYLYTGPEAGERNDAVLAVKQALKKRFGQVEEYLFYASETPAAEYMAVLENEPLFSDATCVVVKNADAVKKKDEVEVITSWIASSSAESSVLILVSDAVSIDSKIETAVPAKNKKVFWEMFEDRKLPWLKQFFSRNGYRIADGAAESVLELVENNTEALRQECSRFFLCFPPEHEISAEDVDAILAHNREESAFTLFAAAADGASPAEAVFGRTLEILQKIRLSKENSPVMIIAGLASCFRRLALWQKLEAAGTVDDFSLKTNGFASKKLRAQYGRAARVWTPGQTAAVLSVLAAADMEIRSGGSVLEDVLLQKMLYEVVVKKGAFCAEYEAAAL
ncbi:MAG: DNA polymerase III subunit delta [Treponemataceae bacterium]|nr:DNA polymerase III subunit delta [Treponemataceae bacterium]